MKPETSPDATGAVEMLALIREVGQLSRSDILQHTGLARSTVNQRLAALQAARLIAPAGAAASTGGRPSTTFAFTPSRGSILTADVGASGVTVAICDLDGTPLRHESATINVATGPHAVLDAVTSLADDLRQDADIWASAIGVPGPVEFEAGRVVKPPIMTGWDGFDIAGHLRSRYGVPAFVENDANARAIAAAHDTGTTPQATANLVFLKIGTGIGAGLILHGRIIRGHLGAAGDIGHTHASVDATTEAVCRCGNLGCVEAYAGGWAIVRDLHDRGIEVNHVHDVVRLTLEGQYEAVQLVRRAGRIIGDAVSTLVSVLNPSTIVIGGQLARCGEVLLSGIRERVYRRAQPLTTGQLTIDVCDSEPLVGSRGLALIAAERLLSDASFLSELASTG